MAAPPASTADGLDTAKLLVQRIARTFYGNRAAILVDQLVQKECFRDEELARRLGMQIKDITKIAHRLVEDQIVQVHRRSEMRDNGMMKAQQRAYYFLDYSKAIDVIKWRMWRIQQTIDVKLRNELDAQGYVCPLCKASYTPLDAASLYDPMSNMFRCSVCQTEVINNENEDEVKGNKDRMQRLNRQTKVVVDLLKRMDKAVLPRFNIEAYLAIHGPALGATAQAAAEAAGTSASHAAVVKVQIAGDDDEANELRRRERQVEEKRAQNALPSWIAQSTISAAPEQQQHPPPGDDRERGDALPFSSAATVGGATLRLNDEVKPVLPAHAGSDPAAAGNADLDAYYASLENAAPAAGAGEGEDEEEGSPLLDSPAASSGHARDGDEDELELEGMNAGAGNKRERGEEDVDDDEAGSSKRARVDVPIAGDEDDDDEFEDEFELADGTGSGGAADPNQHISVNGKMLPFADVTEDMTGDMTADEYSAYWEVYQQVNA